MNVIYIVHYYILRYVTVANCHVVITILSSQLRFEDRLMETSHQNHHKQQQIMIVILLTTIFYLYALSVITYMRYQKHRKDSATSNPITCPFVQKQFQR
jgi:heme/copper-type cytochrome/quinol oxidase subunit 2